MTLSPTPIFDIVDAEHTTEGRVQLNRVRKWRRAFKKYNGIFVEVALSGGELRLRHAGRGEAATFQARRKNKAVQHLPVTDQRAYLPGRKVSKKSAKVSSLRVEDLKMHSTEAPSNQRVTEVNFVTVNPGLDRSDVHEVRCMMCGSHNHTTHGCPSAGMMSR